MESIQTFSLEPVSPVDRADRQREKQRYARETSRRVRAQAREKGVVQVNFNVAERLVDELDRIQKRDGLKNRSVALESVLTTALAQKADPQTADTGRLRLELPPESLVLIDQIQAAKGLKTRAEAVAAILELVTLPGIRQELGL